LPRSSRTGEELRAKQRLRLILPIVFFVVFMLLYLVFHSVAETLVLIFPTIYAMSGGLLLQWLLNYNFSGTTCIQSEQKRVVKTNETFIAAFVASRLHLARLPGRLTHHLTPDQRATCLLILMVHAVARLVGLKTNNRVHLLHEGLLPLRGSRSGWMEQPRHLLMLR
jgi:hypothetical protein